MLVRHTISHQESRDSPCCEYCGFPFDVGEQIWVRDELELFCSVMCCNKRHPVEDDPPEPEPQPPNTCITCHEPVPPNWPHNQCVDCQSEYSFDPEPPDHQISPHEGTA